MHRLRAAAAQYAYLSSCKGGKVRDYAHSTPVPGCDRLNAGTHGHFSHPWSQRVMTIAHTPRWSLRLWQADTATMKR